MLASVRRMGGSPSGEMLAMLRAGGTSARCWPCSRRRRSGGDLEVGVGRGDEVGVADQQLGELRPLLRLLPALRSIARRPAFAGSSSSPCCRASSAPVGVARLLARLGELSAQGTPSASLARSTSFASAAGRALPVVALLGDARDRLERAAVARVALEDLLVGLLRRRRVAEPPLLHLAEPHQEASSAATSAAVARAVELRLEQLRELRVAARLLVELRERERPPPRASGSSSRIARSVSMASSWARNRSLWSFASSSRRLRALAPAPWPRR